MTYYNALGAAMPVSGATSRWFDGSKGGLKLTGSNGNDSFTLTGGDTANGMGGDDSYSVWDSLSKVVESKSSGIDTIIAHASGTFLLPTNVENLTLADSAHIGIGNSLNNIIIANPRGGSIDGGRGNDVLVGGAGNDVFMVEPGTHTDAVYNFQHGSDVIQLTGYGIGSYAELQPMLRQVGADVRLTLPNGDLVTIRGTTLSQLDGGDFKMIDLVDSSLSSTIFTANLATAGLTQLKGPGVAVNEFGWWVLNNAWGSGGLTYGTDYQINSTFHKADMTGGTTFNWSYAPATDYDNFKILAYPDLIFGSSPYGAKVDDTDLAHTLPVQVSALHGFSLTYDVSIAGNVSDFNVAYDIWLTSVPAGGSSTITNELMIWLHQGAFAAEGTRVGTFVDGGFSGVVYNNPSSHYTAVVANSDTLSGTFDLLHLLSWLEDKGIVSANSYLDSVDLGAEVIGGTGSLTVNNLDMTVQTVNSNGSIHNINVTGSGQTVSDFVQKAGSATMSALSQASTVPTISSTTASASTTSSASALVSTTVDSHAHAMLASDQFHWDSSMIDGHVDMLTASSAMHGMFLV